MQSPLAGVLLGIAAQLKLASSVLLSPRPVASHAIHIAIHCEVVRRYGSSCGLQHCCFRDRCNSNAPCSSRVDKDRATKPWGASLKKAWHEHSLCGARALRTQLRRYRERQPSGRPGAGGQAPAAKHCAGIGKRQKEVNSIVNSMILKSLPNIW